MHAQTPEASSCKIGASATPCPMKTSCISLENPFFHSLPTSPTSRKDISLISQTDQTATVPFPFDEDHTSSELDYFEFDINSSGHFHRLTTFQTETQSLSHDRQHVQVIERGDSMPRLTKKMEFDDDHELFSRGKLMTPPLKLPPRLQHGSQLKIPSQSPKIKTSRQALKNDDDLDDPFLIALQNVTSERTRDTTSRRESKFRSLSLGRAWSFSYLWAAGPNKSTGFLGHKEFDQPVGLGPSTSTSLFELLDLDHSEGKDRSLSPNRPIFLGQTTNLSWPKRVRIGNEGPTEPALQSENVLGSEGRGWLSESKRHKIKKFLLGDASLRKADSNAASWKPLFRKMGMRPVRLRSGRDNQVKSVYTLVRMTAVHYRPRLSLCLGGTETM